MENIDQDLINRLPDKLLQIILALVPTKSVIITSALSNRWRWLSTQHLLHTNNLDFGKGFGENQSPQVFIQTVNRVISLNTALKIDKFRLYFDPGHQFGPIARGWINFAISKSVKELSLDFCRFSTATFELPNFLFNSASITHLNLRCCILGLPLEYTGLGLLQSLRLDYVNMTATELNTLLANSPLIETLVINECGPLESPGILLSSRSLKHLTLFCWLQPIDQIVIHAPNLYLISFRGKASKHFTVSNNFSLKEAVIEINKLEEGLQCEDCYKEILTCVSEVKILSVYADYLPHHMPRGVVDFHYLKELKFLSGTGPGVTRFDVLNFFRHCFCPFLESLSIQLSLYCDVSSYSGDNNEETVECNFMHLKTIEIRNFQKMDCQMELVRYFLESSPVLELMILVAPLEYGAADEPLEAVNEKSYHLPNTHSTVPIIYRQY